MKKVLLFVTAVFAVVGLFGCQSTDDADLKEELIVGLEVDYPPFNWAETVKTETNYPVSGSDGLYAEGYDVQVAKLIADALGRKLVIKQVDWKSLIPALETGEIDLIIAGMSPLPDRKLSIDFTNVYYFANLVAVVKADGNYANVKSLSDFSGANGVGQIETVYATKVKMVAEKYGAKELPVRDSVPLIANDILGGLADFTIVEKPVALGMVAANPGLKIVLDTTENIFEVDEDEPQLCIGVRKDDDMLRELVNVILSYLNQSERDALMTEAVENQE